MGDFETVKQQADLKRFCDDHLTSKGKSYVCPNCGSGTGKNGTPAFSIKNDRFKCFSCDISGDVFELAGILEGTEDKREQLRIVAEWAGVMLEESTSKGGFKKKATDWSKVGATADGRTEAAPKPAPADDHAEGRAKHRRYIAECAERMSKGIADGHGGPGFTEAHDYLTGRGFTDDEIIALGIGYDPTPAHGWQRKGETNWINGPRIVLPWLGSDYYYTARAVDELAKELKYDKPKDGEVGPQPLYNPEAASNSVFFIVEGVLDAMAIQLVSGLPVVAVASNNLSNANSEELAALLKGRDCMPVVMLDNDGAGKDGTRRLLEKLDASGIWYMEADEVPGAKDAAELFAEDRGALAAYLEEQNGNAERLRATKVEQRAADIRNQFNLEDAAEVARGIFKCEGWQEPISTGFDSLDDALNGGLRTGLALLGAVSSAGKTTLLIQIADHIAANGWPVLFVSIEQSARELVAKSLSRMLAQRGYKSVTLFEMSNSKYRPYKLEAKENALTDALAEYAYTIAPNICILSADKDAPDVNGIRAAAEYMRGEDKEHRPPVVIVDYLQLIRSPGKNLTDKQAIDITVSTLRRMAKEMETPVIAISSLNRASYNGSIEMDSFKESGMIEYSSDVLLGLQPLGIREYCMKQTSKNKPPTESQIAFRARVKIEQFRHQNPRKCEIVVLKNRTGALPGKPLPFTFHCASSLFVEGE